MTHHTIHPIKVDGTRRPIPKALTLPILISLTALISACDKSPDKAAEKPASAVQATPAQVAPIFAPIQAVTQSLKATQPNCRGDNCSQANAQRLVFAPPHQWINPLVDAQLVILADGGINETPPQGKTIQARLNEFVQPDPELEGLSVGAYEMDIKSSISDQRDYFLSIALEGYYYTGGAHGSAVQRYLNLDRRSQKTLSLDDILLPQQKEKLKALVYQRFVAWVKSNDMGSDIAEYEKMWPFHLSEEWTLNDKGLVLVYGQYEVGPYVVGMPEFEVAYSELVGIVKPDYRFAVKPIAGMSQPPVTR